MNDLTGFQRDLLYVIAGQDEPKGLDLKEDLEEYYQTEVHHGRLYPNLDTLVDEGLVEKGEKDNRTNAYTLTQQGHRVLEARKEWEDQYLQHAEVETDVCRWSPQKAYDISSHDDTIGTQPTTPLRRSSP